MTQEIRQIITDQINRHVAMTDTHRAWLAKDIADRVLSQAHAEQSRLIGAAEAFIEEICTWMPAMSNRRPEVALRMRALRAAIDSARGKGESK
jgi:hypothetical protein